MNKNEILKASICIYNDKTQRIDSITKKVYVKF